MIHLVTDRRDLEAVIARAATAPRVALDAEGNGMHAYRARLCTLQLAWRDGGATQAAVIDTLAVDPAPMADLLGSRGPVKVLHDLTFDARMLVDRGIVLGNVEDTSVAARFLDEKSTGLSALSETYLGISISKDLQHHDWSERPLEPAHLDYLAGDVIHLLDLADLLRARVAEKKIEREVALESTYKLATGIRPPAGPPEYTRAKGYRDLAPVEQAILRRLFAARDALAASDDVPPHKIAPTAVLVEIARRRPRRAADIRRLCRGRATRYLAAWLEAVAQGVDDGAPPAEEQPSSEMPSREVIARRRALERALSRWRSAEAAERGVSQQVILPGHCLGPLVSALIAASDPETVATIPGLGQFRVERHFATWRALAEG